MTTPAETSALSADPANNGAASLRDRVKGLRLPSGDSARASSGSGWLPWILCLLMAATWASFGVRAYTTGGWKALLGGSNSSAPSAAPTDAKKEKSSGLAGAAPGEMV